LDKEWWTTGHRYRSRDVGMPITMKPGIRRRRELADVIKPRAPVRLRSGRLVTNRNHAIIFSLTAET